MRTSRVAISSALAMALLCFVFSNVFGQGYARHALIEEGTGTWCQYCPWGAFTIDSMERQMGENLVAISWHGPTGYGEPMFISPGDTVGNYAPQAGYPWAFVGRTYVSSGAYEQNNVLIWPNPWSQTAEQQAQQPSPVDFRIVNAVYHSNSVDFDVDITPFDKSSSPTEDTCTYVVVAVLTEDGIVSSQTMHAVGQIDGFVHRNVARAVGGKVLGDVIVVGTKSNVTWPVRKHYHMVTNGTTNGNDWIQDSLRIKAFAAIKSVKSKGEQYLDAGQTGYIKKLPSTAVPAVWSVLPRANDNITGDSATIPIVWGKGGTAGAKVNMSYSTDNGTTWIPIASGITTTTYEWKIPDAAYGQQVMLQIVDGSNATITSTTGAFSIAPKPSFTVTTPKAGDFVYTNSKQPVNFTPMNSPGENITIYLSKDSMATWTKLGTVASATTYNWSVSAGSNTSTAFIKVTDGINGVGMSGMFSIVDSGIVTSITVDGAPNLAQGAATTVHWATTGYMGETVDLDVSFDGNKSWAQIAHGLPTSTTSQSWTAPMKDETGTIRVMGSSGAVGYSAPFIVGSAGVSETAPGSGMRISPNPMSVGSTITYNLSTASTVSFIVSDLLGREVSRTGVGTVGAGSHDLNFDATNLASGTYEYTLLAGNQSYRGKLSVVR